MPLGIPKRLTTSLSAGLVIILSGCAKAELTQSGFLSDYSRLEARTDTVRAQVAQYRDEQALAGITQLLIEPTVLSGAIGDEISELEKDVITREIDRRICFALSKSYEIVESATPDTARLRASASRILPTNSVGSSASAVVNFFIPGPLGLRVPGSTGGLAAEAEMLAPNGQQVAAIVFARDAQVFGTDSPSLSRIGDAHQLTGAFASLVADAVRPQDRPEIKREGDDPCARFGPRIRPEGIVTRVITGLYTPSLSGAQAEDPAKDSQDDEAGGQTPPTPSEPKP